MMFVFLLIGGEYESGGASCSDLVGEVSGRVDWVERSAKGVVVGSRDDGRCVGGEMGGGGAVTGRLEGEATWETVSWCLG